MKIHSFILALTVSLLAFSPRPFPGEAFAAVSGPAAQTQPAQPQTPFSLHGTLQVKDGSLMDQSGSPFQLYGMSTHGLSWFPQYVSRETFRTLRDDWHTNCIRLAMYTSEYNGYCTGGDKAQLKALVRKGIDEATALGMYVIVDWHVLSDHDPNLYKEDAISFFQEISHTYKDSANILYEICNEPNGGVTWEQIRQYADAVIPAIRANDPDAVIIVGTPNWSQEIGQAAASPLPYDNVLYALHFYAATHTDWLRQRLRDCKAQKLPVFISEFGMCDASGGGANDFGQAQSWMELIDEYNLSYCCWNLSNKAETCSILTPGCQKLSGWEDSDLSESGKWIRARFQEESQP